MYSLISDMSDTTPAETIGVKKINNDNIAIIVFLIATPPEVVLG
jgi:hypothetical protein